MSDVKLKSLVFPSLGDNYVIPDGASGAAEYSTSSTYAVGDYCLYDGKFYRCITPVTTAESWTPAHWQETTIGEELTATNAGLASVESEFGTKSGQNLYDDVHNSTVWVNPSNNKPDPQYLVGTVYLDGYSGDLMISSKGNKTSYFYDPVVYYEDGTSTTLEYGTATYSQGNLRRGLPVTIPSNAVRFCFRYRIATSSATLVEEVMVTAGTVVPAYYEAYKVITILPNSEYVEPEGVKAIMNKVAYVTLNGSDENDGLSPENGLATITKALSICDKIFVQRGTYNEALTITDHDNITIVPYDNNAEYDVSEPYREKVTIKSARFTRCNSLHIEDFCSKDATAQGFYFDQCMNVYLLNCEATDSVSNGFQADNTNITFDRCAAIRSGNDGFNFHSYGQSVMRDCIAQECYDDGVSHHNGCHGTIIGGSFTGNTGKGAITPVYGSDVNIYGAYFEGNKIGLDYLSFAGNHPMTANVVACAFVDNIETGIVASALCTINAINCAFSGNALDTGGGGTINVYNCAAPSS